MGINFRPLPLKCWENYLTLCGYVCVRTKGSHDQWVKRGCRTIPVWGNEKQIPAFHLKTSCKNLNTTLEQLYNWAKENC
jgi:predicted RNA binding protein YcfA (HicA-like mRNA interferase family)